MGQFASRVMWTRYYQQVQLCLSKFLQIESPNLNMYALNFDSYFSIQNFDQDKSLELLHILKVEKSRKGGQN